MVAFAAALALGYRYLETDVHATSDGVLIAFHDDRLDRVTDRSGLIAELPWSEVRLARVAGQEPIVELAELLASFPGARINIDPKHDAAVAPLIAAVRAANALERVCIGSFSDQRLAAVREGLGPGSCTSLGPSEVVALRLGAWGARPLLGRVGPSSPGRAPVRGTNLGDPAVARAHCVQVPVRFRGVPLAERRLIHTAHELGLPVHVWTVNDRAEMARLLDLGVDGLMTDTPAALRELLIARGEWHAAGTGG